MTDDKRKEALIIVDYINEAITESTFKHLKNQFTHWQISEALRTIRQALTPQEVDYKDSLKRLRKILDNVFDDMSYIISDCGRTGEDAQVMADRSIETMQEVHEALTILTKLEGPTPPSGEGMQNVPYTDGSPSREWVDKKGGE